MPSQPPASLEPLTRRPLPLAQNRVYRRWRGGALLDRFQGVQRPEDGHFPEDWVGSTTVTKLPNRPPEEGLSRVTLPGSGTILLRTLIEQFPEAMLGAAHVARHGRELGVLCKLLDSAMRLPIQSHPDRVFARQHLGSTFGKTESWLVLATRTIGVDTPHILFGFRDGVTEADFRRAAKAQDIPAMVAALNRIEVRPGEVYLVTAGTAHAIGPGVFLIEVQEPTDLVVNAEYSFGEIRRTEAQCFMGLDFDLGMRCFDYRAAGEAFVSRHTLAPRTLAEDPHGTEELLIGPQHTPCFGVSRLSVREAVPDRDRGRCYVGIVTAGRGRLRGDGIDLPLQAGGTFFVPALSRHASFEAAEGASLEVIKCFPPAA